MCLKTEGSSGGDDYIIHWRHVSNQSISYYFKFAFKRDVSLGSRCPEAWWRFDVFLTDQVYFQSVKVRGKLTLKQQRFLGTDVHPLRIGLGNWASRRVSEVWVSCHQDFWSIKQGRDWQAETKLFKLKLIAKSSFQGFNFSKNIQGSFAHFSITDYAIIYWLTGAKTEWCW